MRGLHQLFPKYEVFPIFYVEVNTPNMDPKYILMILDECIQVNLDTKKT